jgi:chromosome partitioning protein
VKLHIDTFTLLHKYNNIMSVKLFLNKKGGVAKTSSTINTSAVEAIELGKKVLMIAFEPQNDVGIGLGMHHTGDIAKELMSGKTLTVTKTKIENVDIVLGSHALAAVESSGDKDYTRLRKSIQKLISIYDEINIDCPPNLGILTMNALVAADYVICPLEPSIFALNGLVEIQSKISLIQNQANPNLRFLGVLLTRFASNVSIHKETKEQLEQTIQDLLFKTYIRTNISISEAQTSGEDVLNYAPSSNGAADYRAFTRELHSKINQYKKVVV